MKKFPPTSPARRQTEFVDFSVITKKYPERSLVHGFKRGVGRNSQGRITTRHKGGGVKRLWRVVDFMYDKQDISARVASIEYDPNRTCFIALLVYRDGEKRYILAPQGLRVGSEVVFSKNAPIETGNGTPLGRIPIGTSVYNIEFENGRGAQLVRSAGSGAIVLAQEGEFTNIQLPSKEIRMVRSNCWASVGSLSNPEHGFMNVGKAGRTRLRGIRPSVRGTAMNPRDHPHGGGEGRTQRGRRRGPATAWGKPARGVKTRKKGKGSDMFILQKRKK